MLLPSMLLRISAAPSIIPVLYHHILASTGDQNQSNGSYPIFALLHPGMPHQTVVRSSSRNHPWRASSSVLFCQRLFSYSALPHNESLPFFSIDTQPTLKLKITYTPNMIAFNGDLCLDQTDLGSMSVFISSASAEKICLKLC